MERLNSFWQDFRFAIRGIKKDRGFALVAIFALALGIGATTVIFSVIENVLIEPFPYRDADRLAVMQVHDLTKPTDYDSSFYTLPQFLDIREQNHVFDDVLGVSPLDVLYQDKEGTQQFTGASVTANAFEFLGMKPLLGRNIVPDDGKPGAPPVFSMSYRLWKKEFNADPRLVGTTLVLNGEARTLVGVMPPRFLLWNADMWVPLVLNRSDPANQSDLPLDNRTSETRRHHAAGGLRFRGHHQEAGEAISHGISHEVFRGRENPDRQCGRALQDDSVYALGGGEHVAADRVQQCCQPSAGARHRAGKRNCHSRVHGRVSRSAGSPTAGRKLCTGSGRLSAWLPVCLRRTQRRYGSDAAGNDSRGSHVTAERFGDVVCRRRHVPDHDSVRTCSRHSRRARRLTWTAERHWKRRQRKFPARQVSFRPGGLGGRAIDRVAGGRRSDDAQPVRVTARRTRTEPGQYPGGAIAAPQGPLRDRSPEEIVLQPGAATRVRAAGSDRGNGDFLATALWRLRRAMS